MTTRISRRTVLRGMGTAMALPMLEAMLPEAHAAPHDAEQLSSAQSQAPRRMAFIYVPNGVIQDQWIPRDTGTSFELPSSLKPLESHRNEVMVLSGLTCDKARPNGDGAGDHARASASFLTGAQAAKTSGANIKVGLSADQLAAQKIGDRTRLASLEIAVDQFRGTGNCDSGYACVYEHTLAWRSPTAAVPTEVNPRLVFERLFASRPKNAARLKRDALRASVLDTVLEDARDLEKKLGGADQQKLDQYLTSVREVEKRIQIAEKMKPVELPEGTVKPDGRPSDLTEHYHLMCDLMVLAFQTDVTRIITFMFGREGSNQRYRMIGVRQGHHELTHHRGNRDNIEQVAKINKYHIEQFAYLVGRLKSIKEGDSTLLDNCMIAYGSAIGDGNRHSHHDLPILLAGKGGGSIQSGRHVRYRRETPLNNLWLAMLERMGVEAKELGDSTGILKGLS